MVLKGVMGPGPQHGGPSQSTGPGAGGEGDSRAMTRGEAAAQALSRYQGSCHQIIRVGRRW